MTSQGFLPSSWIIAIRQGRQDDELSELLSPWNGWGNFVWDLLFSIEASDLVAS